MTTIVSLLQELQGLDQSPLVALIGSTEVGRLILPANETRMQCDFSLVKEMSRMSCMGFRHSPLARSTAGW